MEMQGNRRLAVTQQQAWDALNDPEILKLCIPGCDKVEATGENQYAISMAVK
ncbi:MAG: carbon monoxide dehydrogenase, partial [Comamonadaceae bacterium]